MEYSIIVSQHSSHLPALPSNIFPGVSQHLPPFPYVLRISRRIPATFFPALPNASWLFVVVWYECVFIDESQLIEVARARERIFGPQGSLLGDRYFRKDLEGRKLMQWYFPSKYGLSDFRVDDYAEMQAERLAPRQVHPAISAFTGTLRNVSKR